ncbi:TA system VapC family ribonuclease toxin [Nostocoides veronense]|uniref:Ribonuclease VapC n=1 Tax=Nostocoides veronense TaxID=330836 RepID=A0ABN2LCQ0_9MICO
MTTYLLDANVLIALAVQEHVHHARCDRWLATVAGFATCPITQGAVVRFLLRSGASPADARRWLAALAEVPGHDFWADDLAFDAVDLTHVTGHRQVTDACLRSLALARGGVLATLDEQLAALSGTLLIPALPA